MVTTPDASGGHIAALPALSAAPVICVVVAVAALNARLSDHVQVQGDHSQPGAAERPSGSAAISAAAGDADQHAARPRRGVVQRRPAAGQPGRLLEGHDASAGGQTLSP